MSEPIGLLARAAGAGHAPDVGHLGRRRRCRSNDRGTDMSYDLVVRNGRVVDGTGREAHRADVGISGDA